MGSSAGAARQGKVGTKKAATRAAFSVVDTDPQVRGGSGICESVSIFTRTGMPVA